PRARPPRRSGTRRRGAPARARGLWWPARPARPATTVPATTVPATTVPATTVPATTVPATTVPATTVPATTVPATTVPPACPSLPDVAASAEDLHEDGR